VRTFEPMLSPGPLSWEPLAAPASRRWLRWFIPFFIVLALLAAANVRVPYFILAPGTARQVDDLIHLPEGKAYPPKGRVLLATVSLISDVRLIDLVRDRFDDETQSIPERLILGDQSKDQLRQANLQMMDNSKQIAVVVALRRLGHSVTEHGDGALVQEIVTQPSQDGRDIPVNQAAALQLQPGDVIVAADGAPTALIDDAKAAISRHAPGDVIRLDLLGADGSRRVENVPLVQRPGGAGAILGVVLQTKGLRFDLPFPIEIDSLGIGGPSAGLAYTLGVIDVLTPGELTGGKVVAVTGEILSDGSVGDVGGVTEKTAAVRAAGADYFLVPKGEYEEAKAHAGPRLKVFKVDTLDTALQVLGSLGGDLRAIGPPPQPVRG
jgi:PDZ domain-containing protein